MDSAIQRLNNEGFIESLYSRKEETVFFIIIIVFASLGPIQLTREVTAKPFCWIYTGSEVKDCVVHFFCRLISITVVVSRDTSAPQLMLATIGGNVQRLYPRLRSLGRELVK